MALEQDFTALESSPSMEDGGLTPSDSSAPTTDAFDPVADTFGAPPEEAAPESPRSSRRRRRADRISASVQTKLAGAVAKLSQIEDDIAAHMLAAEQMVQRLETRGDHQVAGYSSRADFEQRLLASTPIIHAMRVSVAAAAPRKEQRRPSRGRLDARTRRAQALESVAQTLTGLRAIDVAIHRAALSARDTLSSIERDRLFDECGYPSFEEFLERALGPSPVLAAAIALAEREPAPEPEADLVSESEVEDAQADSQFDALPSFSSDFMNESPPDAPSHAEANVVPPELPAAAAAERPKFSPKQLAVSVALCIAATFAGGAGGSWSAISAFTQARAATAAAEPKPATTAEPKAATAIAPPKAPAHPAAKAAATAVAPKEVHAPEAARTVEVDPLSIPMKVHARPAGPREARR